MKRKTGYMKDELIKKILSECSSIPQISIHYHLNGEPLLDNRLSNIISYGRERNPSAHHCFFTNGSLLSEKANKLFENKNMSSLPDDIMISFDGGDKYTYEKHRAGLSYENTINGIRCLAQIRNSLSLNKPKIHPLMVITKDNEHTLEKFRKLWVNILTKELDSEIVSIPMNWAGAVTINQPSIATGKVLCPWINDNLFILYTGEAVLCCMDNEGIEVVGNTNIQTIQEIYNSNRYSEIRHLYNNKKWDSLKLCRKCIYGDNI
jgi:hypothetical protein